MVIVAGAVSTPLVNIHMDAAYLAIARHTLFLLMQHTQDLAVHHKHSMCTFLLVKLLN